MFGTQSLCARAPKELVLELSVSDDELELLSDSSSPSFASASTAC